MTTSSSTPDPAADTPAAEKPLPLTRVRFAKTLPPVPNGTVPYAKSRPELKEMDEGELMNSIVGSEAWNDVMRPVCEELDRTRPTHGPKPLYTSEELEFALVYQLFCGLRCYREARDRLAGDRGAAARAALGFDRPRSLRGARVVSLTSGVPSEPTITRHLQHFDPELRCATYRLLFERFVRDHLAFPEFREEARVLAVDGTHILTHFTAPVYRELTKEQKRAAESTELQTLDELCSIDWSRVVNDKKIEVTVKDKVTGKDRTKLRDKITCRDGGHLPYQKATGKGGHGFNLVAIPTANGVPLEFAVVPITASEKRVAEATFRERFARNVLPYLDRTQLHVLSADGAFTSPTLRSLLRSLGILENIHMVSHSKEKKTQDRAKKKREESIPIEGYENWTANGHREIKCECGHGLVSSRMGLNRQGHAFARLEGSCAKCGTITITSGQWLLAQNPKKFRLVQSGDPANVRDWTFGNPLTYDNPISEAFGKKRFGHNEGFHGALESRFRLIKGKRWYRSRAEAETDTAVIFCVMHALAMEQRRRAAATVAVNDELAA